MDFSEAQAGRLQTPEAYAALYKLWWQALLPQWKNLFHTATTPELAVFARKIAATGLSPFDVLALTAEEVATKTQLHIENAITAKIGAEANRRSLLEPANVLLNANVFNGLPGDLSLRCVEISKPADDSPTLAEKRDIELLAHAGPEAILTAESTFHTVIVFPASIVFTQIYDSAHTHMLQETYDAHKHLTSYEISMYLETVSYTLYTFTIAYGIIQIIICAYAQHDDRLSSQYLTVPFAVRFADLISIVIAFVFIGPWLTFISALGEMPSELNGPGYWSFIGAMCLFLQLSIFGTIAFFYFRMSAAYYPVAAALEIGDIPGNPSAAMLAAEALIISPGAEAAPPAKEAGFFARAAAWAKNRILAAFSADHGRRVQFLGAIGRYRRRISANEMRQEVIKEIGVRGFFGGGGGGSAV